jgi:transcriptional regulator with XRE-family HTH domain
MESIAKRALAARKNANMTQKQAQAASGVNQSSISKIERGDTNRSANMLALARAYNADPHWLDTGDGPPRGTRLISRTRATC